MAKRNRRISAPVSEPAPATAPSRHRAGLGGAIAAALILILATALRLVGLDSDLWLDELWSRRVAIGMSSAWSAFTLHHEVNHHLTTVWLYLMGPEGTAVHYRLPSLVCGIASVGVAGLIGQRRSRATAAIAMLLTAVSYELVLFSSEARGYSMAVLCTLAAYLCLERQMDRPSWQNGLAYATTATIGLFTQPVFSSIVASAGVWSVYRWARSTPRFGWPAAMLLGPQVLPVIAFAVLYLTDLRYIVSGGGTATPSLIDAYGQSLAWTLGTPDTAGMKLVFCVIAVTAVGAGLRWLAGGVAGGEAWTFFAGAIVVFPNVLVIVRGSEMIYTRHFLLGSALALVLISFLLGSWWARGRSWKAAVVTAVLLFAVANGLHIRALAERGRGGYREAIRFMADEAGGRPLTIGGDHDFRIGLELDYYLPVVLGAGRGRYYTDGAWPPGGPMWVIANADHYEPPVLPHNIYRDGSGNEYEYVRTYLAPPLSGLHWFLFRNRAVR